MKRTSLYSIMFVFLTVIFFAGCEQPADQEVSASEKTAAKRAEIGLGFPNKSGNKLANDIIRDFLKKYKLSISPGMAGDLSRNVEIIDEKYEKYDNEKAERYTKKILLKCPVKKTWEKGEAKDANMYFLISLTRATGEGAYRKWWGDGWMMSPEPIFLGCFFEKDGKTVREKQILSEKF